MTTRWVLIPFASKVIAQTMMTRDVPDLTTENKLRAAYAKQVREEWKIRTKEFKIVYPGSRTKFKPHDGDVIYVQAHGYTNRGDVIGGDYGIGKVDADGLITVMTTLGLDPSLRDIKVKVWACYSGFLFANQLYQALCTKYPHGFAGLTVDGYTGATRATFPHKSVKQMIRASDGVIIAPWIRDSSSEAEVQASLARVRYGPKP